MRLGSQRSVSGARGFTVIEVLAVGLILAVLMALAVPSFQGALIDSRRKNCQDNLQNIASLQEQYKIKNANHVYAADVQTLRTLVSDPVPPCPDGGRYTFVLDLTGRLTVRCSYHYGQYGDSLVLGQ